MIVRSNWLQSDGAQRVLSMLEDAGFEAYFVGGCVRNSLMGLPASDLDISTSAHPNVVVELANQAKIKALPTGIEHGTVTLVLDGEPYEITTFRKDISTDGRRADVRFASTVIEDARRRDFTMNALYCDARGLVLDPLGGLADLEARRVVFIEDPSRRIQEDYLRILRFFRFHAWYGNDQNGIDSEGLAACASNLAGLETLSRERVGSEMIKLLAAEHPEIALGAMDQSGALATLLPGAGCKTLFALSALGGPADAITRLAALGGSDVAERLRLSKVQTKTLNLLRDKMGASEPLFELSYRFGAERAEQVARLNAAVFETPMPSSWRDDIQLGVDRLCPVRAKDMVHLRAGPSLGEALKEIESRWIASRFQLKAAELIAPYEENEG